MGVRQRAATYSAALAVLLAVVMTVSAGMGPVYIEPIAVTKVILNAVAVPVGMTLSSTPISAGPLQAPAIELVWHAPFSFGTERVHEQIVLGVRLPRIILGATVGFALATAGTVMQGFFKNPMADPSIIGVSSGAAVGAVAFIVVPSAIPFGIGLRGAAFVGAVVTAFLVYLIATQSGRTPVATLLLAGIAVQAFLSAVISFLQLYSGESLRQVVHWLMGHLGNARWGDVGVTVVLVPALFVIILAYGRDLNVLLLGEADAKSLGVEVERTKKILLVLSSVITAAGVAVSGVIGFVGLIVPHMVRLIVGPDHRVLLPTAALAGASFLVLTDTIARTALGGSDIPVGVVTAALGAPFFLYLLRSREVHSL
ncbi:vitamin B12 ABC transporter permease BtuC [Halalkalirubrum salinum]|uniref:vitamin B12 ABC transporter permease BtuC n=1 Tax=Halalkalirubrum salinum TaxID=2563889 RepID=UPI0010FAE6C1|nr:vitamin B12 ABC transporter permease BtuC [Halalkalirubrum salinum]